MANDVFLSNTTHITGIIWKEPEMRGQDDFRRTTNFQGTYKMWIQWAAQGKLVTSF